MPLSVSRTNLPAVASGSHQPTLQQGSKGQSVSQLQRVLKAEGFNPGPIDGDFGPMTKQAVLAFQRARGLEVDGVVGPQTWNSLESGFVPAARPSAPPAAPATSRGLRMGDMGAEVQTLQRELQRHGFSVDVDGSFGPQTRQGVVAFQRAHNLDADGVVGPLTWAALRGAPSAPAPRPTAPTGPVAPTPGGSGDMRSRMLDIARGELGTRESGQNGGAILKYPHTFGRGSEAWCADFASWVTRQAGGSMNDPYCPSVVNTLKRHGDWKGKSNPQPGDLVLFDWDRDGTADHIGLVERVNGDGTITTIEGNTTNPNTGEEGVWRRTRTMSTVLGFGNPY